MTARVRRTDTVVRISNTEIAAIAGSMLSLRPIHITRGKVIALTLDTKRVTPISSQERTNESKAAVRIPNLMLGKMTLNARCATEAPRPRAARSMRRST